MTLTTDDYKNKKQSTWTQLSLYETFMKSTTQSIRFPQVYPSWSLKRVTFSNRLPLSMIHTLYQLVSGIG